MNPLATLLEAQRPVVAASFDDTFSDEDLTRAQAAGVEVVELRVDMFKSVATPHVLEVARRYSEVPRLITVRSAAEGGRWSGTEEKRLELYTALMPLADAIDIELGSCEIRDLVVELAASEKVLTVMSYHNFTETPDDPFLAGVLRHCKEHGADLVKISVHARTEADMRRLARFTLEHSDAGLITISMGAKGTVSRVMFPALGSRLTYADIGLATGPGQLRVEPMCGMMRQLYPSFPQG